MLVKQSGSSVLRIASEALWSTGVGIQRARVSLGVSDMGSAQAGLLPGTGAKLCGWSEALR
jgi:hypothetical protein